MHEVSRTCTSSRLLRPSRRSWSARALAAVALAMTWPSLLAADGAMSLIMIEDPGCPYCKRWDEEVREAYLASHEGRIAPLRRYKRSDPAVTHFKDVVYSPTFILVRDGAEIDRIVGYPGADFFWAMLVQLLAKAGNAATVTSRDGASR